MGLPCDVDARDKIIGVVALLDATFLDRDVAEEHIADAHDRSTFQLRAHAIRVDDRAAIDRHIETRYRDLAVIANGDMRDDSDIAQKAAMDGEAAALPRRQLLTPIAVRSDEIEDTAQAPGVDQILVDDPGSELVDAVIR